MKRSSLLTVRGLVEAILPVYDPTTGNVTDLHLHNGEVIRVNHSLHTVLREYLALWAFEKLALQHLYADDRQHALVAPLAIQTGHTLIPLKARHPIGKHDGAYGYVELESMLPLQVVERRGGVQLSVGSALLEMCCSKRQVLLMVARGEYAARRYQSLNGNQIAEAARLVYLQELNWIKGAISQSEARMQGEAKSSLLPGMGLIQAYGK